MGSSRFASTAPEDLWLILCPTIFSSPISSLMEQLKGSGLFYEPSELHNFTRQNK